MGKRDYVEFKCLELQQPIGTFYVGTIEAQDLVEISFADVHRIEEHRDVERIVGVERPLVQARVKELQQYVRTVDATFPASIILAVSGERATYDARSGSMQLLRDQRTAEIIDGQHRIAGLRGFEGRFQIPITIFVDIDLEDKAMVFATINLKQTRVGKSLAYNLFEYATTRSPQKTCHNIAKLLNSKEGSPLFEKIKILGAATGKPFETLTQATFVERLIKYISDDPMKDRDILRQGKKLAKIVPPLNDKLIFRNMFIEEKDAEIARVIYNYFAAVGDRWSKAWFTKERGMVLSRTTGFGALMRLLRDAYLSLRRREEVIPKAEFVKIFSEMELTDDDFNPTRYKPGTSGETDLYNDLIRQWRHE